MTLEERVKRLEDRFGVSESVSPTMSREDFLSMIDRQTQMSQNGINKIIDSLTLRQ